MYVEAKISYHGSSAFDDMRVQMCEIWVDVGISRERRK